jgi:broad specificity phosphatase PhoE
MRYLEVRRHTMRIKPNKHISQAGVIFARRVGEGMGSFDRVITSDLPRAFETAIAMGYAVDEQMKALSRIGSEVEAELDFDADFGSFARVVRKGGAAAQYARRMAKRWLAVAVALPDGGHALMVSHGGIIELGAIGCLPDANHAEWGAGCNYCEGVRLHFDGKTFVDVEILRVQ